TLIWLFTPAFVQRVRGQTPVHVCATCPLTSIQAAIGNSAPGTVIQVAAGTYPEQLVLTKSVTVQGGWNLTFEQHDMWAWRTVVNGQGAGAVISISQAAPIVEGLWLIGGSGAQGGGVWIADAQPLLYRNVISGNRATGLPALGGGIYAEGAQTQLKLDANWILANQAQVGGGLFVQDTARLTATNNIIAGNVAQIGGGIYTDSNEMSWVVNNTVVENLPSGLELMDNGTVFVNNIVVSHTLGLSLTHQLDTATLLLAPQNLFSANTVDCVGSDAETLCAQGMHTDPQLLPDYHLFNLSPAIDQGTTAFASGTDVDGERRAVNVVDLGADEAGMHLHLPIGQRAASVYTAMCPLGISLMPQRVAAAQAAPARAAGACWTRLIMYWDQIEPVRTEPRTYDWETTDALVRSAANAGLRIILTVAANPAWAAEYPGGPVYNETEILGFLTAAAERYDADGVDDAPGSPYVHVWEMYNEPDNESLLYAPKRGWGYWGGRGAAYALFLSHVRVALRVANPRALLAFGGIAHEASVDIFDMDFPHEVFAYVRDHPGEYFDYFNFHYFPVFESVWQGWGRGIAGKADYFDEMMAYYGVRWPMLVTEAGYWSGSELPSPWTGSYEEQARYVPKLYARSASANLVMSSWLLLSDVPNHDADRGLRDIDDIPKPAYNAYQTFANVLNQTFFVRALSTAELGHVSAEGYLFKRLADARRIYVLWTNDESVTLSVRVQASAAMVRDKVSDEYVMTPILSHFVPYQVKDGDDGTIDGQVWVTIGPSPLYVEEIIISRPVVTRRARRMPSDLHIFIR
ncbi:MAG: right-handed parallel beta-helix repeat-containing protein, partial [Anaerolineae bacterium]